MAGAAVPGDMRDAAEHGSMCYCGCGPNAFCFEPLEISVWHAMK